MCWIDGRPAVIGGNSRYNKALNDVEVIDFNKWIRKPSMVHPRAGHTACNYLSKAFVIGGNEKNNIEVYENNQWKEINLYFSYNVTRIPGIVNNNKLILLLGNNQEYDVYDLASFEAIKGLKNEENIIKNSQNHYFVKSGKYKLVDNQGELTYKYSIIL